MARQIGCALLALIVVGSGAAAAECPAQADPQQQQAAPAASASSGHERRRGWWHDQRIVADLGLTPEQVTNLDRIFSKYTDKAVPLRKEVEDLEKALDKAIREHTMEVPAFAVEVDKIENKRAELNKMRTVMLYRLRRVLNAEQNAKFQAMTDRREAERRKQDGDRRR